MWACERVGTWRAYKTRCSSKPTWRIVLTQTRAQYDRILPEAKKTFGRFGPLEDYDSTPAVWFVSAHKLAVACAP